MTDQEKLAQHKILVRKASKLLAGIEPEIQGSALAELLATWLGGWPPALRAELLAGHLVTVHELLPHVEVNKLN